LAWSNINATLIVERRQTLLTALGCVENGFGTGLINRPKGGNAEGRVSTHSAGLDCHRKRQLWVQAV
jgi:hypothetical protein